MPREHDGGILSIQDLILTLKGSRTYRGLAAASGGVVTAQRWNQLANGKRVHEFPEPRTIEAMALALNVRVETVLLAIAKSLGMDVHHHQSTLEALLPPGLDDLTDEQRSVALAVIAAMRPQVKGEPEATKTTTRRRRRTKWAPQLDKEPL